MIIFLYLNSISLEIATILFIISFSSTLEFFLKELLKYKDTKYKLKMLDLSLEKQAYNEFIEFKKTKVFNARKA